LIRLWSVRLGDNLRLAGDTGVGSYLEAKMVAALNHPNIATINGLEDSNGTSYFVMEPVPGETPAERIKPSHSG
jgi:serine/threonine protein kinase